VADPNTTRDDQVLRIGFHIGGLVRHAAALEKYRPLLETAGFPLWLELLDQVATVADTIVRITDYRERFPAWAAASSEKVPRG
jgi:hypothetical protein